MDFFRRLGQKKADSFPSLSFEFDVWNSAVICCQAAEERMSRREAGENVYQPGALPCAVCMACRCQGDCSGCGYAESDCLLGLGKEVKDRSQEGDVGQLCLIHLQSNQP